jgi:hypothetical protein
MPVGKVTGTGTFGGSVYRTRSVAPSRTIRSTALALVLIAHRLVMWFLIPAAAAAAIAAAVVVVSDKFAAHST